MLKPIAQTALSLMVVTTSFAALANPVIIHPPRHHSTNDSGVENQLRAAISQSFALDGHLTRQVLNLTEQKDARANALVIGDYKDGFQVTDSYELSVGAGPAMSFWFNNPTGLHQVFQASTGLIPSIGKEMTVVRIVPDEASVKKLPRLNSAPMKASDLQKMHDNDSIDFGTEGGLTLGASLTQGILAANAMISISGEFEVYVQRNDAKHAYVEISTTKVKSAEASIGASLAALAVSTAKSVSRGISFDVDISDEKGAHAYEDLVRGNVAAVQALIAKGKLPEVQPQDKYRVPQVANYLSFSIGLSELLEISWSEGHLHELNDTVHLNDGSSIQTFTGVYVADSERRIAPYDHEKIGGFYGVSFVSKDKKQNETTGKFGQFNWSFSSNWSSTKDFTHALRTLVRRTGLGGTFNVGIPDDITGTNVIAVSIDLSDEQTDALMALAKRTKWGDFENAVLKLHDAYFAQGDADELCKDVAVDNCPDVVADESTFAARQMHQHLLQMADALDDGDQRAFTDAYAKFGHSMLQNEFTFQLALQLAGGQCAVEYDIQGSKISHFHRSLKTPPATISL